MVAERQISVAVARFRYTRGIFVYVFVCFCFVWLYSEQTESTLKQVEEIETAIREAGELRAETRNLQRDTDSMVAEINNITQSVSCHAIAKPSRSR